MEARRVACPEVLLGFGVSAVAFALSPLLMPPTYSWVAHTVSQAASQGQPGSWLSRVGFLVAGLTILRLATCEALGWSQFTRNLHRVTGFMMLGAIVFTDRSWNASAPFDPLENAVHSLIATLIYLTFAGGVLAHIYHRLGKHQRIARIDVVTVALMLLLPPMMLITPQLTGLVERLMFGAAYVWYGVEVIRTATPLISESAAPARFRARTAFSGQFHRRHPGMHLPGGD